MFTPGEISADGYEGYLTNKTITGLFAQAIQGAVVMVERTLIPTKIFEATANRVYRQILGRIVSV